MVFPLPRFHPRSWPTTCKGGGDFFNHHNFLRDVFADSYCLAHLSVKLEVGNNLTPNRDHTRLANDLVHNWTQGKPLLSDLTA